MTKQSLIITLVVATIFGIGGFYGGTTYAKSKTPSQALAFAAGGQRQGGGAGTAGARDASGRGGAGFTGGSVVSNDGSNIVVSLTAGGSKNVLVASSTQFVSLQKGSAGDVTAGKDIIITGTPNADGSITATMVQIRPADLGNIPGFGGGLRGQGQGQGGGQ
ncbi:MAG: hypothetical protein WC477_01855 [Patescibacteria group bacterium]